jgi:hypothetical protein
LQRKIGRCFARRCRRALRRHGEGGKMGDGGGKEGRCIWGLGGYKSLEIHVKIAN